MTDLTTLWKSRMGATLGIVRAGGTEHRTLFVVSWDMWVHVGVPESVSQVGDPVQPAALAAELA